MEFNHYYTNMIIQISTILDFKKIIIYLITHLHQN